MGARKKSGRGVFWTTSELRPVDDCSPGRGGMAQDGGARGGTFHGEKDRCRESQGWLRHAVICPNVTGRTKERTAQSKRARAGSLAIVDSPQVARTCILQADVVLSFSGVTFILCFVTTVCVLFRSCFFLFFVSLEMSLFPSIFCTITVFSLYGEYVVYFFLPDGVFLPCDHGLDFGHQLM